MVKRFFVLFLLFAFVSPALALDIDPTLINYSHTDSLVGETYHIYSSQKDYADGFNEQTIYLKIVNNENQDANIQLSLLKGDFLRSKSKIISVERFKLGQRNNRKPTLKTTTNYASVTQSDVNGWVFTYWVEWRTGANKVCINDNNITQINKCLYHGTKVFSESVWTLKDLPEKRLRVKRLAKKTKTVYKLRLDASATQYVKVVVKNLVSGEFFVHAQNRNDRTKYGLLDPWFSNDYGYKRGLNLTNNMTVVAQDQNNIVRFGGTTEFGSKALANCNDVRIVYDNGTTTTELDRNFSINSNCQNDFNGWFDLNYSGEAVGIQASSLDDKNFFAYYGFAGAGSPSASELVAPSRDSYSNWYWNFDNNSTENRANDFNDANFNGTAKNIGGVENVVRGNGAGDTNGFNSSGNFIDLNINPIASQMTIEFSVRFKNLDKQRFFGAENIDSGGGDRDSIQYIIEDSNGGVSDKLRVVIIEDLITVADIQTQIIPDVNVWNHIGVTCGAKGFQLYYNGVFIENQNGQTACPNIVPSHTWRVGDIGRLSANDTANVDIDEIRINTTIQKTRFPQAELTQDANFIQFTFGSEEQLVGSAGIDTNEITILDPENSITTSDWNFLDATTCSNCTPIAWSWDINTIGVIGTDQNQFYSFTTAGDYNVSLDLNVQDNNTLDVNQLHADLVINVRQYPQGLDIVYSPTTIVRNTVVDFNGIANDDENIVQYYFGFINPDANVNDLDGNNVQHTFNTEGSHQTCFTAQDYDDLNKTYCEDVNVFGRFHLKFFDENSGINITPDVTINGTSVFPTDNNYYDFNLQGLSGDFTVLASDINRTQRQFVFYDLNQTSIVDENIALLDSNFGISFDWKFYLPDTINLNDSNLLILRTADNNHWLSGRGKTNSNAETTTFMNPLIDYDLNVGTTIYSRVQTTVLQPRRESDGTVIDTPWDLFITNLKNEQSLDTNSSYDFNMWANTVDYYHLKVDANASFFPRTYLLNLKGTPATFTLQPYLVSASEGSNITLEARDVDTLDPADRLVIEIYKDIASVGTQVLVESVRLDDKAQALISGIIGDTYTLKIYRNNVLISTEQIIITSTTVYFIVGGSSIAITPITIPQNLIVNFDPPTQFLTNTTLTQFVRLQTGTIQYVVINYIQNGVTVHTDFNNPNSISFTNTITVSDLNAMADLNSVHKLLIQVIVQSNDVNNTFTYKYNFFVPSRSQDQVMLALTRGMRSEFSCSTERGANGIFTDVCGSLIIVSLLIVLALLGTIMFATPLRSPDALALLGAVFMTVFVWLQWFPVFLFAILVLLGVGASIFSSGAKF